MRHDYTLLDDTSSHGTLDGTELYGMALHAMARDITGTSHNEIRRHRRILYAIRLDHTKHHRMAHIFPFFSLRHVTQLYTARPPKTQRRHHETLRHETPRYQINPDSITPIEPLQDNTPSDHTLLYQTRFILRRMVGFHIRFLSFLSLSDIKAGLPEKNGKSERSQLSARPYPPNLR
jgi:hypothetical protein